MKKRSFILVALASISFTLAVPLTLNTTSSPITYAKSTKRIAGKTVAKAIKKTPDLNPTASVRKYPAYIYDKYWQVFDRWYNVQPMSAPGVFKKHTASVYVANQSLKSYTYAAMQNWNKALKVKAFKLGTKAHHTITVGFKNAGTGEGSWDGYYITSKLYINYNFFDNAKYLPAVYKAETGKTLASADQPNSADYQALYDTYWKSVITHELGHSLSLDHTPYSNDIMEADSGTKSGDAKYSWSQSKVVNDDYAIFQNKLSSRDINRAKLTRILGYW
ncbi:matrixin family metalloprotease [Lentilactobacillus otakiensis]|uniref:Peptidase M10A and M12B matrixinand adamalysin n=1 Tax=Lentilactobacillus otakiensis DSM 19908 = JCM 15040 TaxID=1423780 RepID=S4PPH8_9LACO|nr:matrixin family metalloprotease [Lentilactobacillus otakiensis]KRL10118.1 peptidase M10A and M12B matrixin and adamalysin [Lentilactobacillus otakiensis DSM 19908 = JCM 15040]MDV3517970.1 matrixin family metalloprotease [Lentilactobacillus otakiensis]GAD16470.1 peptidase M10A and M12B matrixinand adamalysin [Lentilactobacillus otakiensis DSM 19908 = JCM 15040]